jgi:hypothetical protein
MPVNYDLLTTLIKIFDFDYKEVIKLYNILNKEYIVLNDKKILFNIVSHKTAVIYHNKTLKETTKSILRMLDSIIYNFDYNHYVAVFYNLDIKEINIFNNIVKNIKTSLLHTEIKEYYYKQLKLYCDYDTNFNIFYRYEKFNFAKYFYKNILLDTKFNQLDNTRFNQLYNTKFNQVNKKNNLDSNSNYQKFHQNLDGKFISYSIVKININILIYLKNFYNKSQSFYQNVQNYNERINYTFYLDKDIDYINVYNLENLFNN